MLQQIAPLARATQAVVEDLQILQAEGVVAAEAEVAASFAPT